MIQDGDGGGAAIFKMCPSPYNDGCPRARVSLGFICKRRARFSRHERGCARLHCLTQNVGVIYHAGESRARAPPSPLSARGERSLSRQGRPPDFLLEPVVKDGLAENIPETGFKLSTSGLNLDLE